MSGPFVISAVPSGMSATARRTRLLAVAVSVVFLLPAPLYVITGWEGNGGPAHPLPVLLVVAGIATVHARHGVAAIRGERPAGWRWTLLALVALVNVPLPWWEFNWVSTQSFVVASLLMLLRGPQAVAAGGLVIAGTAVSIALVAAQDGVGLALLAGLSAWWITGLTFGSVALWGAVRLVRLTVELASARAELAEAAVAGERLRVSRDLHDLLGQSLSAVSLKGDLALALLDRDPQAARAEIAGLSEVARGAVRDMRAVTRNEHTVALADELDGAVALLNATGIATSVDADGADLSGTAPGVEQLFAWAVREGVTNVLRHSDATTFRVRVQRIRDGIRLEIVNDGVAGPGEAGGNGLAGLATRAAAVGGTATGTRHGDQFHLVVVAPVAAGDP